MKRRHFERFRRGSWMYVLAHAQWKKKRGRLPSMPYRSELNPRKALEMAKKDSEASRNRSVVKTRDEYMKILGKLPIENPTPEDMAMVCPHLTEEQVVAAFQQDHTTVACPPIIVRNAFQIICLDKGFTQGGITHPPRLSNVSAGRTPASYADDQNRKGTFPEYPYMDEAMSYAEDRWWDDLIIDTWNTVLKIMFSKWLKM